MELVFHVYLCVNDNNYCHMIFDTMSAASNWCQLHTGYHVIIRGVYTH